jgi:hypothetical protein
MCAICKWISEAPIGGISEVTPARVAGACIWRYEGEFTELLLALENVETGSSHGRHFGNGQPENLSELRRIGAQTIDKLTN